VDEADRENTPPGLIERLIHEQNLKMAFQNSHLLTADEMDKLCGACRDCWGEGWFAEVTRD
jgi:hypothetical protein